MRADIPAVFDERVRCASGAVAWRLSASPTCHIAWVAERREALTPATRLPLLPSLWPLRVPLACTLLVAALCVTHLPSLPSPGILQVTARLANIYVPSTGTACYRLPPQHRATLLPSFCLLRCRPRGWRVAPESERRWAWQVGGSLVSLSRGVGGTRLHSAYEHARLFKRLARVPSSATLIFSCYRAAGCQATFWTTSLPLLSSLPRRMPAPELDSPIPLCAISLLLFLPTTARGIVRRAHLRFRHLGVCAAPGTVTPCSAAFRQLTNGGRVCGIAVASLYCFLPRQPKIYCSPTDLSPRHGSCCSAW